MDSIADTIKVMKPYLQGGKSSRLHSGRTKKRTSGKQRQNHYMAKTPKLSPINTKI